MTSSLTPVQHITHVGTWLENGDEQTHQEAIVKGIELLNLEHLRICCICRNRGFTISCAEESCMKYFHPSCALYKDWHFYNITPEQHEGKSTTAMFVCAVCHAVEC